jgi:hypothetical protein
MRILALPEEIKHWSLTTLRETLVKIGARFVRHGVALDFSWRRWRCLVHHDPAAHRPECRGSQKTDPDRSGR